MTCMLEARVRSRVATRPTGDAEKGDYCSTTGEQGSRMQCEGRSVPWRYLFDCTAKKGIPHS